MLGRIPSVDNLQCFIAAAEHLNFRRAAQTVELTPAAFGQRIKQLETDLGVDLFRRTTRVVELTPEGHRMVPAAREAVAKVAKCAEVVIGDDAVPVTLTVATHRELGTRWLAPAIIDMRDQLEHITVDLVFGSASEVVDRLRNSEVDAAVTTAKLSHKEWTADALHPEQHVLVGAPDLLADQPFDTPADAAAHTLLDIDESLPLGRHLTGTDRDVRFGTTRLGGDAMAIRLMVLQGLGVAVLPRDIVAKDIEAGRLTPILGHDELHTNEYSLVYRSMSVFDSALKRLAGFLAGRPIADF